MIQTDRLIIRPLEINEVMDTYIRNLNDKEYMKFMDFQNTVHTKEMVIEYIIKSNVSELEKLYGVFIKSTNTHAGNIRLTNWHKEFKKIELGILIFKEHGNKSVGTESLKALTNYVFNNYDIKKISAGVYEHNKASYNMFKRVGFNVEGFEKYHAFINGKFLHRYVLAIYNENI